MAVAMGGADCHVRCRCQGGASGGTGMPFRTLGKNPCARVAMDVSACRKENGSRIGHVASRKGSYRGYDATEDKTETMYVGIAVSVVLHRGLGGVFGDVVRLVSKGGQRRG